MSKKKKNKGVKKSSAKAIQKEQEEIRKKKSKRVYKNWSILFFVFTLLLIPSVYYPKAMDPALMPRFFVLAIVLGVFLIVFSFQKRFKEALFNYSLKKPFFIILISYFIITVLSLAAAYTPTEGIYDVLKAFLLLVFILFAFVVFISNDKDFINIVLKIVLVNTAIILAITLYDTIDSLKEAKYWFRFAQEIKGLMANKNQLSIALFLLLPFNAFAIRKLKSFWKVLAIVNLLLLVAEIIIIRTRSVYMAFGTSFFIFLVVYLVFNKWFSDKKTHKQRNIIILVSVGALLSIVAFARLSDSKIANYVRSSVTRVENVNEEFPRFKVWKGTWQMAAENPALGVGAGNWKIHMADYYKMSENEDFKNWRRPHNDFLWVFSEKGILGALLYLALFAITLYYCIKIIINIKPTKSNKLFILLIFSTLIGYMIIAFLTFPYERINHQLYLFLMMAIILTTAHNPGAKKAQVNKSTRAGLFIITLGIFVFSTFYGYTALKMEVNIKKSIAYKNAKKWKYAIYYANKGYHPLTKLAPSSAPIKWYTGLGHYFMKDYKTALSDFKKAYQVQPNHPYVLTYYASMEGYFNNNDLAIKLLKKTLKNYPGYEDALTNIFAAYYKQKQFDSAYHYLQMCDPKSRNKHVKEYRKAIEQTFINLAVTHYNKQQYDSAFYYISKCDTNSENKTVGKYYKIIKKKLDANK